jgi:hypothetical protein
VAAVRAGVRLARRAGGMTSRAGRDRLHARSPSPKFRGAHRPCRRREGRPHGSQSPSTNCHPPTLPGPRSSSGRFVLPSIGASNGQYPNSRLRRRAFVRAVPASVEPYEIPCRHAASGLLPEPQVPDAAALGVFRGRPDSASARTWPAVLARGRHQAVAAGVRLARAQVPDGRNQYSA